MNEIKRRNVSRLLLLLMLILFSGVSFSQITYYVDATNGNDNNIGTSESSPWQTLSKVSDESADFKPGDKILFKRGEVWYGERINSSTHASGSSDNYIVYGAYGTGDKPVFDLIITQNATWVSESSNIWSTTVGVVSRFFKNSIEMLRDPLINDIPLGTQGTEYYTELINGGDNYKLYIYSTIDPTNETYQWAAFHTTFYIPGANYIKINDIDFRGGTSLELENNSYIELENCNIGYNSDYGVVTEYATHIKILQCDFNSNYTVDQSTLNAGAHGIDYTGCNDAMFVGKGSEYVEIGNSYFKNWTHSCLDSETDEEEAKIHFVSFHNNTLTAPDIIYGGMITYSGYSEDGEYYNNNIYDIKVTNHLGGSRNHFHHNIINGVLDSPLKNDRIGMGIWLENYNVQIRDNVIENNIIANTDSKGIEIYSINFRKSSGGEVSGNIIRNNILYNCGLTENNIAIQFHEDEDGQKIYNNIVENNVVYSSHSTNTCLYQYNGALCNVATFNFKNSHIKNNIADNPLFVDLANNDYHLEPTSPAIDAGAIPLAEYDFEGRAIPVGDAADIGIYEYCPAGVETLLSISEIKFYPNPTTGVINLIGSYLNSEYQVVSLSGEVVKGGMIQSGIIDLTAVNSGIYFIKITNDSGEVSVAKLIKK